MLKKVCSMRNLGLTICLGPMILGAMISAGAAEAAPTPRIGTAVEVVNQVRAEFEQDRRELQKGDGVHQNELVEVGEASIGELVLEDKTKLALGPGSRILLDKFVYDGEKTKGDIVLNLVKGTFRFITGVATKNSYRIRTPAAAITVRGTIFDVFIASDSSIWILLMEGSIRACNDQGTCRNLDRPGQILRVSAQGDIAQPSSWPSLPGRQAVPFDEAFPFVANAPGIDPNPTLTRDAIVLGRLPAPPKKETPVKTKKPRDPDDDPPPRSRQTKAQESDDAANLAVGLAIGFGVGRAIGGGRRSGGDHHRPPTKPPSTNRKF